ncbi:hypothetical protein LM602_09360 [Candidatus Acetothermia bacterium]|jgi:hypothetical protein|nr:hypothetical protein [Candidatus Acetothermia bacterium]MCI2432727.1 hypothetical protein [Candidatus Acetothermia bacterium]MCI2435959.1 hypothetical protein [Candidatus Acetothermia bacterium]
MTPAANFLQHKATLGDLLNNPEHFEKEFINNPRSLERVPPHRLKIEIRSSAGVLGEYLFGAHTNWQVRRPNTIPDARWNAISSTLGGVNSSFLNAYHYIVTTYHVFIEEIAPELLLHHARAGIYAPNFNQCLVGAFARIPNWQPGESIKVSRLEEILRSCTSSQFFIRDPALILNHLRVIRNNVIHRDPSVQQHGGDQRWGEIYLRYYEAFLEELQFVIIQP